MLKKLGRVENRFSPALPHQTKKLGKKLEEIRRN
jgi:hypothetical protein